MAGKRRADRAPDKTKGGSAIEKGCNYFGCGGIYIRWRAAVCAWRDAPRQRRGGEVRKAPQTIAKP